MASFHTVTILLSQDTIIRGECWYSNTLGVTSFAKHLEHYDILIFIKGVEIAELCLNEVQWFNGSMAQWHFIVKCT